METSIEVKYFRIEMRKTSFIKEIIRALIMDMKCQPFVALKTTETLVL
jgi:hypothetical protein